MTNRVVLSEAVLPRGAVRPAVQRRCAAPPDLLPPDPADAAVAAADKYNSVARWVSAKIRGGLPIAPRAAVAAYKGPLTTRPVLPLSLPERVIFDALIEELDQRLQSDDMSDEPTAVPHAILRNQPIEREFAYIVGADVNSFYQYIDHQILTDQLVGRTGDWDVPNALRELLGLTMGNRTGLPQGLRPIRLLADVYIAPCVRALRRSGYAAWAHSDDMRIGCASRRDAHEALQVLDDALRDVGLSLNTEKCWVRDRESYTTWAARPTELRNEFATQHHLMIDLWELAGPYEDDEQADVDDSLSEDDIRGTVRQIFEWVAGNALSERGAEGWAHRHVITEALRSGRRYAEPGGLEALPTIVPRIPQLTDDVCQYLRFASKNDEDGAGRVLQLLCSPATPLSRWQVAWLSWAALDLAAAPELLLQRAEEVSQSGRRDVPWAWSSSVLLRAGRVTAESLALSLDRIESAVARDVLIDAIARSDYGPREALAEAAHEKAILAAVREDA